MAFWGKKKNNDNKKDDSKIDNQASSESYNSVEELEDEMKIIMEAKKEAREEKQAKAEERARAVEEERQRAADAESAATKAAASVLSKNKEAREEGGIISLASFFMVIDDIPDRDPEGENNLLAAGMLRGELKEGQKIYLYHPNAQVSETKIARINEIPSGNYEENSDKRVELELEKGTIPYGMLSRFGVLTDCPPQTAIDHEHPFENPRLLALTFEYDKFNRDPDYFNSLISAAVHARFLVPSFVQGEDRVGILSLKDLENEGMNLIPAFTDITNLERGKNPAKEDPEKNKILVLSFQKLSKIATEKNNSGLLINPFGPVSIRLPKQTILDIVASEPYKNEFDGKEEEPLPGPSKGRIALGPLPEGEESKNIKQAIVKVSEADSEITRVGAAIKIEEETDKGSYLFIVDTVRERMQDKYHDLFEAVKPYLTTYKSVDFMLYEDTPFADDYFAQVPLVYDGSENREY